MAAPAASDEPRVSVYVENRRVYGLLNDFSTHLAELSYDAKQATGRAHLRVCEACRARARVIRPVVCGAFSIVVVARAVVAQLLYPVPVGAKHRQARHGLSAGGEAGEVLTGRCRAYS